MASLLSLPRELRDTIIGYVVSSDRRTPPIAQEGDQDPEGAERVQFEDTYWKDVGNLIYFEKSPSAFQPTCGGLLLACRQLRAETLAQASKIEIPSVLDLLIVNEQKIWVTWLSVPVKRSTVLDKLRINVRLQCDGYDWGRDQDGSARTHNFTLIFGTQMRNLLYRVLAVGYAGPLPDDKRRQIWTGARYKFKNTIRFEHEYIPHKVIRKLEYHFADRVYSDVDEGAEIRPYLIRLYIKEWEEILSLLVCYNVVSTIPVHPGWKSAPERVGGVRIWLGEELRNADWADLSTQYALGSSESPIARTTLRRLLEIRDENGL